MTCQCYDNCQGRFTIMFWEDSQIDFAKENVIFLSDPHHPLFVLSILKPIISLKFINKLLKITCADRLEPNSKGIADFPLPLRKTN